MSIFDTLQNEDKANHAVKRVMRINLASLGENQDQLTDINEIAKRSSYDFKSFLYQNYQFLIPQAIFDLKQCHLSYLDTIRKYFL